MAPELHAGVTTPLSDIYSFGVTAYALVTGRLPFAGPPALYYSQKMERDYIRLPAEVKQAQKRFEKYWRKGTLVPDMNEPVKAPDYPSSCFKVRY